MANENLDNCELHTPHTGNIAAAVAALPAEDKLRSVAELYKLFSDFSRVKLLSLLLHAELCVGDLTQLLNTTQPAVSNHLRLLRGSKLVKYRKEGKCVFYSLADSHVASILEQALEHVSE
jgi:ArsR family transcriptional regulator, lead/cadmium/zinc/bismuth-responsive transcriptional repressor